ncbi:HAD hydrolase, IA, variant 1 family protein [Synechococcus sp. WH 8103]|nr:HAD hydrolase, IA, variant 1 family protein [Synechococcus sp. WH 8103]
MHEFTNIIFDLDGTLIDSSHGIYISFCSAVSSFSLVPPSFSYFRSLIGPPVRDIIRIVYPSIESAKCDIIVLKFRECYDNKLYSFFEAYPFVAKGLYKLHSVGLRLYIVTNKPTQPARSIIESLNLSHLFHSVIGIDFPGFSGLDHFPSKAHALSFLLSEYSLPALSSVYVGDTSNDLKCSRSVNLPFIGVTYGFGDWSSFHDRSIPLLSDFRQLSQYLSPFPDMGGPSN